MNHEAEIKNYSNQLERASWFLTLFGMMTQCAFLFSFFYLFFRFMIFYFIVSSEVAFPSYNVALGFWGAYCAYTRHGRATFGLGTVFSVVLSNKFDAEPFFALGSLLLAFWV